MDFSGWFLIENHYATGQLGCDGAIALDWPTKEDSQILCVQVLNWFLVVYV